MYPYITIPALPRLLRRSNLLEQMMLIARRGSRNKRSTRKPARVTMPQYVEAHLANGFSQQTRSSNIHRGQPSDMPAVLSTTNERLVGTGRAIYAMRKFEGMVTTVDRRQLPVSRFAGRSSSGLGYRWLQRFFTAGLAYRSRDGVIIERYLRRADKTPLVHAGTTAIARSVALQHRSWISRAQNIVSGGRAQAVPHLLHGFRLRIPFAVKDPFHMRSPGNITSALTDVFPFPASVVQESRYKRARVPIYYGTDRQIERGGTTIHMNRGLVEHLSVVTNGAHNAMTDIQGQVEKALLDILGNITTIR